MAIYHPGLLSVSGTAFFLNVPDSDPRSNYNSSTQDFQSYYLSGCHLRESLYSRRLPSHFDDGEVKGSPQDFNLKAVSSRVFMEVALFCTYEEAGLLCFTQSVFNKAAI